MVTKNIDKTSKLIDFNYIGDSYSADDLIDAYLEGKKDFEKEIESKIFKGLQTSALSSSLFKEKLKEIKVSVSDMYLRILNLKEFECLVIINDKDYYTKDKRWKTYEISRNVNNGLDDVDIRFSLMPLSEELKLDTITSEGFYYKYETKK